MVRDFFMEEFNMTEETTQNVASATAAEQEKEITMHTYYWSNDDVPFRVIRTTDEITKDQYPMVVAAPDPTLKAPKYDWIEHKWIGTEEESLGARLTSAVEQLENAQKAISSLQEAHKDTVKDAKENATAMSQLQQTVQMSNQIMSTLSVTVAALTKAYQSLNQSENTTNEKQGDAQ